MLVSPAVRGLEAEWQGGNFLRLNVGYERIRAIGDSLQVTRTPTFILFNAQGQELQRWIGEAPALDRLPTLTR